MGQKENPPLCFQSTSPREGEGPRKQRGPLGNRPGVANTVEANRVFVEPRVSLLSCCADPSLRIKALAGALLARPDPRGRIIC